MEFLHKGMSEGPLPAPFTDKETEVRRGSRSAAASCAGHGQAGRFEYSISFRPQSHRLAYTGARTRLTDEKHRIWSDKAGSATY